MQCLYFDFIVEIAIKALKNQVITLQMTYCIGINLLFIFKLIINIATGLCTRDVFKWVYLMALINKNFLIIIIFYTP